MTESAAKTTNTSPEPLPSRLSFGTFIAGIAFLAAVAAAALFFTSGKSYFFPILPTGTFIGWLDLEDGAASRHLYVESDGTANTILIGVFAAGWSPQTMSAQQDSADAGVPLILSSPLGPIRLTGERVDSEFRGTAEVLEGGRRGSWSLHPLVLTEDDAHGEDVALWLRLREERANASTEGDDLLRRISSAEERLEELTSLVTDAAELKKRTQERDRTLDEQLRSLKADWKGRRLEMTRLAEQVEGQRRVTGRGKLVALSRDVIERQDRWLDSMFRAHVDGADGLSDEEYARANRLIELRQAIAEEKQRLGLIPEMPPARDGADSAPFSDIFRRRR